MIVFIAFVGVCLIAQSLVNSMRGKPKLKVRMGNVNQIAECGCVIVGLKVVTPCHAHRVLLDNSN